MPARKATSPSARRRARKSAPKQARTGGRAAARNRTGAGARTPAHNAVRGGSAGRKKARPARARPQLRVAEGAEGNMPVQAYIAMLPGWQKALAQRLDGLIEREVPYVRKAMKQHTPVYGTDENGWFASIGGKSKHLKLSFLDGSRLKPAPPGGAGKDVRYLELRPGDPLDEETVASWVRQAVRHRAGA